MEAFKLNDLQNEVRRGTHQYLEFLRVPALSMGLYELQAGARDLQEPHKEDEIYFVVSGRAVLRIGEVDQPVSAGSILYVAADVRHYFHTITEDLSVLVFFAPAEYTQKSN